MKKVYRGLELQCMFMHVPGSNIRVLIQRDVQCKCIFFLKIKIAPNKLYFGSGTGCHGRATSVKFCTRLV